MDPRGSICMYLDGSFVSVNNQLVYPCEFLGTRDCVHDQICVHIAGGYIYLFCGCVCCVCDGACSVGQCLCMDMSFST